MTLRRSLPPVAYLTGTFGLTTTAHDPRYKDVAQRLGDFTTAAHSKLA